MRQLTCGDDQGTSLFRFLAPSFKLWNRNSTFRLVIAVHGPISHIWPLTVARNRAHNMGMTKAQHHTIDEGMSSYWCHECKAWRQCEIDSGGYLCGRCGEDILCDECGQRWTNEHASEHDAVRFADGPVR